MSTCLAFSIPLVQLLSMSSKTYVGNAHKFITIRLWVNKAYRGGSIIFISSISSQIINKISEKKPLAQVIPPSFCYVPLTPPIFSTLLQLFEDGCFHSYK